VVIFTVCAARTLQEFNKKSNSLYTILRSSKLAGSQRAPFLRQFLLRLNYNSFFEVIRCFAKMFFIFYFLSSTSQIELYSVVPFFRDLIVAFVSTGDG